MRVALDVQEALQCLRLALRVIPSKGTLEALAHAHLSWSGDDLMIHTTNLEQTLVQRLPVLSVDIHEPGPWLLPLGRVVAVMQTCAAEECVLTLGEGKTILQAPGMRTQCAALHPDLFPAPPSDPETTTLIACEASALRTALIKTVYAVSSQALRVPLTGLSVHVCDATMVLHGCDGHRLAQEVVPIAEACPDSWDALITREAVALLIRLLGSHDGVASLARHGAMLGIAVGETRVFSRLLSAEYPDVRAVIPSQQPRWRAEHGALVHALEVCESANPGGQSWLIASPSDPAGLVVATLGAEGHTSAQAHFSSQDTLDGWEPCVLKTIYLLELLRAQCSDTVSISMKGPKSVLRVDTPGGGFGIVMPLNGELLTQPVIEEETVHAV